MYRSIRSPYILLLSSFIDTFIQLTVVKDHINLYFELNMHDESTTATCNLHGNRYLWLHAVVLHGSLQVKIDRKLNSITGIE